LSSRGLVGGKPLCSGTLECLSAKEGTADKVQGVNEHFSEHPTDEISGGILLACEVIVTKQIPPGSPVLVRSHAAPLVPRIFTYQKIPQGTARKIKDIADSACGTGNPL
jgi:hypothetical protein